MELRMVVSMIAPRRLIGQYEQTVVSDRLRWIRKMVSLHDSLPQDGFGVTWGRHWPILKRRDAGPGLGRNYRSHQPSADTITANSAIQANTAARAACLRALSAIS
jgi:hypothetical protein